MNEDTRKELLALIEREAADVEEELGKTYKKLQIDAGLLCRDLSEERDAGDWPGLGRVGKLFDSRESIGMLLAVKHMLVRMTLSVAKQ